MLLPKQSLVLLQLPIMVTLLAVTAVAIVVLQRLLRIMADRRQAVPIVLSNDFAARFAVSVQVRDLRSIATPIRQD